MPGAQTPRPSSRTPGSCLHSLDLEWMCTPRARQVPEAGALHLAVCLRVRRGPGRRGGPLFRGCCLHAMVPPPAPAARPARSSRTLSPGLRSQRETQTALGAELETKRRPPSSGLSFPSGPREGSRTGLVWVCPEAGLCLGCAPAGMPSLHRPECSPPERPPTWGAAAPGPQAGVPLGGRLSPLHRQRRLREPFQTPLLFFFQISPDARFFYPGLRTFF